MNTLASRRQSASVFRQELSSKYTNERVVIWIHQKDDPLMSYIHFPKAATNWDVTTFPHVLHLYLDRVFDIALAGP